MQKQELNAIFQKREFSELTDEEKKIVLAIASDIFRKNPLIWRLIAPIFARYIPDEVTYYPTPNEPEFQPNFPF